VSRRRWLALAPLFLALASTTTPSSVAQDDSPPLQVAERLLSITAPDGTDTNYACITTGMHLGRGIAGPGYDAATYNVSVILEVPIEEHNSTVKLATPNLEGIACRVLTQDPWGTTP
jgi:hypothetical protein